jgi:hypothetical protein
MCAACHDDDDERERRMTMKREMKMMLKKRGALCYEETMVGKMVYH